MDKRSQNQERRKQRMTWGLAPVVLRGPFCEGCDYFVKLEDPSPCDLCPGWTGTRKKRTEPLPPVRPPKRP